MNTLFRTHLVAENGDGVPDILAQIQEQRQEDEQQDEAVAVSHEAGDGVAAEQPYHGDEAVVYIADLVAQGFGGAVEARGKVFLWHDVIHLLLRNSRQT